MSETILHDKEKQKIILFGSQITLGGAQRVLLDQAEWFQQHGYDVHVLFYYDKDGLLSDWQKQYPFPIDVLSNYRRNAGLMSNIPGLIIGLWRLRRFLMQDKPDVIECFTHHANVVGLPIAFLCHVPRRIASHHGAFAELSPFLTRLHSNIINSRITDKIVCVSARAHKQALAEGIHQEKICVIYNAVKMVTIDPTIRTQVRKTLGITDEHKMVLNVGRLVPEKAQNLLISAANLCQPNPQLFFFIAGDGPLHIDLQQQISENKLENTFTLLGARTDVPDLLNASDLFILYSDTEGMPVSLMEAMSANVPVIASDLEGIRELVPSDEYGVILPSGDAQLLANAIHNFMENPQAAADRAGKARERIQNAFSLDILLEQYRSLFFDV